MALIDQTYFNFEINISQGAYSDLLAYIDRFEPEILNEILGYDLAALVLAYGPDDSEQRIIDIVEGISFQVDYEGQTRTIKWRGLANEEKISLLAYHVYYRYLRSNVTTNVPIGEVKANSENSVNADLSMKVMDADKRFHNEYEILYLFLANNAAIYPEWVPNEIGRINSHDL